MRTVLLQYVNSNNCPLPKAKREEKKKKKKEAENVDAQTKPHLYIYIYIHKHTIFRGKNVVSIYDCLILNFSTKKIA